MDSARHDRAADARPSASTDEAATLQDLAFSANVRLVGIGANDREIQARATVVNVGEERRRIGYGDCGFRLLLYHDPDLETQAWRSPRGQYLGGAQEFEMPQVVTTCADVQRLQWLGPGEEFSPPELANLYPLQAVLGDSLESGCYVPVIELELNRQAVAIQGEGVYLRFPDKPADGAC